MKKFTLMFFLIAVNFLLSQTVTTDTNSVQYRLFDSAAKGNLEAVNAILNSSANLVNARNNQQEPLIVTAIRNNKPEIVKLLIEKGADKNVRGPRGLTPVHWAVFLNNYELTKYLIEKGVNLNVYSNVRRKPIQYAATNGNIEIVKLHLANGESIKEKYSEGSELIHWAAFGGDTTMFNFLISSGSNIKAVDNSGADVMLWAASGGKITMLNFLYSKGFNKFDEARPESSPLYTAIQFRQLNSVKFFVEKGLDVKKKLSDGNFLLHHAGLMGTPEIINYLVSKGADLKAANDLGQTPLFTASLNGRLENVKALVESGAEIIPKECVVAAASCCTNAQTPVHAASLTNRPVLAYFIEKGAPVNIKDSLGITPLHNAIWGDSLSIVNLLLANKADVNSINNDGQAPIHIAVNNGNAAIVKALLQSGADIKVKDKLGRNLLHLASIKGYDEIVKILIESGLKATMSSPKLKTPLEYAALYGHKSTAAILKEAGDKKKIAVSETFLKRSLNEGEAILYYLCNSAWVIKTKNNLLIIDYFKNGREPADPSVINGWINPDELKDEKVTVFATHNHGDHYDPLIWQWKDRIKNISYVMGMSTNTAVKYQLFNPHTENIVNGIKVYPIVSTDAGQGYLIEVDGITIYHPGDHASRTRNIPEEFRSEIDYLAGLNKKIDIAFLPVLGCGFPDVTALKLGNDYTTDKLKQDVTILVHGDELRYMEYAKEFNKKHKNIKPVAVENRGDRLSYKNGKVFPLK